MLGIKPGSSGRAASVVLIFLFFVFWGFFVVVVLVFVFVFWIFETGFLCVALAVLKFTL